MTNTSSYKKNLNKPDEVRDFPRGQIELVNMDGLTVGRASFEPGWKWSEHVKPIAGTSSCQAGHIAYVISGQMVIKLDDGTEIHYEPGDIMIVPPGHDAWVVGDERFVGIDFAGLQNYALPVKK